jgi:hypothetical protein
MSALQNFLGSSSGLAFLAFVGIILLFTLFGGRPEKSGRTTSGESPFRSLDSDGAEHELPVESEDPDFVERVKVSQYIADLMMADEWGQVGTEIADWEKHLVSAPGGARFHDVGADVALSGLQSLIDAAPHAKLEDLDEAEYEVGHFIDTHQRHPNCHVLAALTARAHLALGEACRADHWPEDMQRDVWRKMARHFLKAGEILERFDPLAYTSPLLAEAHYLQALGSPGGAHRLPELFEQWISLDPSNPMIYECHAKQLDDIETTSDETILTEAERALERTEDILGTGGYALFFLPLLDTRDGARDLLDTDLFASAMLDLASKDASQAEVNQTANALASEMRATATDCSAMNDTLYLLTRWHLKVIYPRLWTMPLDSVQSLVRSAAEAVPDDDMPVAGRAGQFSEAA